jgi:hypothetical protein
LRVLDFATFIAAPFCAGLLGEQGAEIVKIEQPGTGDFMREIGPFVPPDQLTGAPSGAAADTAGYSLFWAVEGRGRQSVTCDLRTDAGQDLFRRLERANVGRGDLQLAFDFTIASSTSIAGRLLRMRDDAFKSLGGAAPVFTVTSVQENPNAETRRRIRGTFEVPLIPPILYGSPAYQANTTNRSGSATGKDAAAKMAILATVAFNSRFNLADVEKIVLSVYPSNRGAIALYRRFGFAEEGRLSRQSRKSVRRSRLTGLPASAGVKCFRTRFAFAGSASRLTRSRS